MCLSKIFGIFRKEKQIISSHEAENKLAEDVELKAKHFPKMTATEKAKYQFNKIEDMLHVVNSVRSEINANWRRVGFDAVQKSMIISVASMKQLSNKFDEKIIDPYLKCLKALSDNYRYLIAEIVGGSFMYDAIYHSETRTWEDNKKALKRFNDADSTQDFKADLNSFYEKIVSNLDSYALDLKKKQNKGIDSLRKDWQQVNVDIVRKELNRPGMSEKEINNMLNAAFGNTDKSKVKEFGWKEISLEDLKQEISKAKKTA